MTSRRRPASSPAARQTAEADRPKLKTLAQRMREGVLDALGLDGRPARRKPRIESLEPRVYMSASPAPVMVGDRLHIELGAGDDQVVIEQLAPGSGGAAD
ncbi:MAG: LEPR-XLL domain-containing protein, partial [Aquabacterium sp.]